MSLASRVRIASRRLVLTTRVTPRTTVLPVFNSARLYSTKKSEAAYTVDKFPGYVRNNDFKQVKQKRLEEIQVD
jgi:D-lactate dehydrogenase (cytochrome)